MVCSLEHLNLGDEVIISNTGLKAWGKEKYNNPWIFTGKYSNDSYNLLFYNRLQDEDGLGHHQESVHKMTKNNSPFLKIGNGQGYWWFEKSFIEEVVGQEPLDITECL